MDNRVQKMLSVSLYVLLGIIFAFCVILVLPVYHKYIRVKQETEKMEKRLDDVRKECVLLTREVHDLEYTADAVEKVAREKFQLCRPDEQLLLYQ